MSNYTITGKTISGNYLHAPRRSGKPVDCATRTRITVTIDGIEYDRAIYERAIWRNHGTGVDDVIARFVIVNGVNYEVAEVEDEDEPEARVYQRYELEAFLGEPDDFDVDAIEAEVRDRWGLYSDSELADVCMAHLKAEAKEPVTVTGKTVWNTTTESTYELDVDHDLLAGLPVVQPWLADGDTCQLFALDADDIEWWESHPDGIDC